MILSELGWREAVFDCINRFFILMIYVQYDITCNWEDFAPLYFIFCVLYTSS